MTIMDIDYIDVGGFGQEVGVKIGIINGEGYETVCRRMR